MPTFSQRSSFPVPVDELFAWHERPGAIERLMPPWEALKITGRRGGIRDGDEVDLEVRQFGATWRWTARHQGYEPGRQFVDEQVGGPFRRWVHQHLFSPDGEGSSQLEDRIDYELPLGGLGAWVAGGSIAATLEQTFRYRHLQTARDLARHQAVAAQPRQVVAITGASGLVGVQLSAFLTTGGHEVRPIVRRPRGPGEVKWDPSQGLLDPASLEGVTAVVHLAGENVGQGRWTAERRRQILDSRVLGTRLLCQRLAAMVHPPKVLISASAVGIYGDRGEEELDEGSSGGEGFLADVCRAWEAEVAPAEEAGIRVVKLRIGVVLSASGGALGTMLLPFRMGLGGPVGSGRQYLSWIGMDDLVGAIYHAIYAPQLHGVVNATAPHPVTSAAFARGMGEVLSRPAFMPLPSAAVKLGMGQQGQEILLSGCRVLPQRLLASGFRFQHPELDGALRRELGLE